MSAISWTPIEKAIHAWVTASSGLAAARVVWGAQNGPAISSPYIVLRRRSIRAVGNDWVDVEDNPTPSAGAEILQLARGQRRAVLAITCYGSVATGSSCPEAIIGDVVAALALPSVSAALSAAGVGISNLADVLVLDGVVNSTLLEPRASVDVFFYVASQVSETATYIEHVEVDYVAEDGTETFDDDAFDDDAFDVGVIESFVVG